MGAHEAEASGYTWSGTLDGTDVRALWTRCRSLRFTGLLELADGPRTAQVTFIGGDAVETVGADTEAVRQWQAGTFRVEQRVPDLGGALTDGVALSGMLAEAPPNDLIRHCEDSQLTCELRVEGAGGEHARVRFAHGKVESSELNGRPELTALRAIASWTQGRFEIVLRPLFGADAPSALPAPVHKSAPPAGAMFDFTSPIMVDDDPIQTPAPLEISAPHEVAFAATVPMRTASTPGLTIDDSIDRPTEERPMPGESTALTRPLPPPSRPPPAHIAPHDPTAFVRNPDHRARRRSRWPLVVVPLVLVAGVVGAAPWLAPRLGIALPVKLPWGPRPASPPPTVAVAPPDAPTHADDPPEHTPEHGARPEKSSRPASPARPHHATAERAALQAKALEKIRRLLVEGHSHSALDAIKSSRHLFPKDDVILEELERMAKGKTGHAEILIEGHGGLTLDGHRFKAPAKVKVAAGLHVLGEGDALDELRVQRGERKHLQAE